MTDLIDRILDLLIAIQQIPAPTFSEQKRAKFLRGHFLAEGLANVEMDAVGNVYGCLEPTPIIRHSSLLPRPLVVSAHMDTVFPEDTDLRHFREAGRIAGAGIGDNATGLAGLLGLVWLLRERKISLPGNVWLVANVCEEGLGNLRGMNAILDRFGREANSPSPIAYLVLEGLALGQVYHRALGVQRYRITAHTGGGHSWIDYGKPSAIHELTALAAHITALKIPSAPRTTLNVGRISGGTSVNTIAAEASLELDLRSENPQSLSALVKQVEEIVREANKQDVSVAAEVIGQRPAGEIPAAHPLVKLAEECLKGQGIEPNLAIGSTDANAPLSRGFPAICLGLTRGGGAHTVHEYIETEPLRKGMEQVLQFVKNLWGLSE
jgi:tripeptide aminopeptidase